MKKQEQKHTSLPWFGIPRIIPYLKAYRWYYPVMVLTALGGTLADIAIPLFQQYALNHFIALGVMAVGLFGMYLFHFDNKIATLLTFGISGFVMITGYIFTSALCGALTRDYTPVENAGKLQGIRMIFSVLIPMLIGPEIGNAINKAANIPMVNPGADAMTTEYIPAPEIFLAGAIVAALALVLVPILVKLIKKQKQEKKDAIND